MGFTKLIEQYLFCNLLTKIHVFMYLKDIIRGELKMRSGLMQYSNTILFLIVILIVIYLLYLIIKALRKYTKSEPVRKQKAANAKNLGEVLKQHRVACKMTQEFVAETIGVSRQAVSKWESGKSDPSTTNLLALAKLFGVEAEELLKDLHY